MSAGFSFAVYLLLAGPSAAWKGYVLTVLWGWFVVPIFGLPRLDLAPAIGLALIVSYLTYQHTKQEDDDRSKRLANSIAVAVLWPAIALLYGWIVHLFMGA